MRAFFGQRRQVLDAIVIKCRQPCSAPPRFPIVPLNKPVSVKVVFDHGQSHASRRANRLLNLLNLFVAPGFSIESLRKPCDHHVAEGESPCLELICERSEIAFQPRDGGTAH